MKRIIALCVALAMCAAHAATLIPVPLINPAGSASGQAVVSTGPSSAPAWGGIGVNGISAVAANTVLANFTTSSASPAAFVMPTCNSSTSALQFTPGTGVVCGAVAGAGANSNITSLSGLTQPIATSVGGLGANNGSATGVVVFSSGTATVSATPNLGTPSSVTLTNATGLPISTGVSGLGTGVATALGAAVSGSGSIVLQTSGTLVTPAIVGATNGALAATGSLGEYPSGTTTGTSLTSNTAVNAASKSLTAGDWDVQCTTQYNPAGSTVPLAFRQGISTTSAAFGSVGTYTFLQGTFATGATQAFSTPTVELNLTSTTTVYCAAVATFSTSTMTVDGFIRARRVH